MNPSENISKKKLDFSNKIRHFLSKHRGAPELCKIRESPFNIVRRSFSTA